MGDYRKMDKETYEVINDARKNIEVARIGIIKAQKDIDGHLSKIHGALIELLNFTDANYYEGE